MKHALLLLLALAVLLGCSNPTPPPQNIVTSDLHNFWAAYDQIVTTSDTALQLHYLDSLFFKPGSAGLNAIMQARRYQPAEYVQAINSYPRYWESIRQNTLLADAHGQRIQQGIDAFKALYPAARDAKVYFEIGVFRTPGTTMDSLVLIGAELAMSNEQTDVSELPERLQYVADYTKLNPVSDLAFLNVHEFVHTQQNAPWAYDLLSQSVFEGSAEFLAELAMHQPSIQPAIAYGTQHDAAVRAAFKQEMFSPWYYNWIWNGTDNAFAMRDLGYYMGYAIVKSYYAAADDKSAAIAHIIELDYTKQEAVEAFVEASGYFAQPLATYKKQFEASRPTVQRVEGIAQGEAEVEASTSQFTVVFSEPMDARFRSTDFGPLGEAHFPTIIDIAFSEDGQSATYTVELKPNTEYELVIEAGYRNARAIPLVPYVLRFGTGG